MLVSISDGEASLVNEKATDYFRELAELLPSIEVTDQRGATLSLDAGAKKAVEMILSLQPASGKVMLIGNGGSAAIASHMQNDLCKAVRSRAIIFNEAPLLMALSNDDGYGCVFERPVELWADRGDLLLAISSSGRSENILRGVQAAAKKGCRVITFSGFAPDNPLRRMGDVNFYVPLQVYGYVEVAHQALGHFMTDSAMARTKAGKTD